MTPSRTEERTFAPSALGVTKRYEVYLPRGYDGSSRRFPVIYMLHGLGGDETNWLKHGDLKRTADTLELPAIVVMPDGDAGFYVNAVSSESFADCLAKKPPFNPGESADSYCVKTPRYEDYIVKDLVADVDTHFRSLPEKRSRGIGGLSMGGFGALELGLRHPDLFGAVASHSGMASLLYTGPHPYQAGKARHADSVESWGATYPSAMRAHLRGIFGPAWVNWREHDPVTLAGKLGADGPRIFLDCGTEDDFKFQDHASELHDVLTARGVEHAFALVPGHHLFTLWKARLPESLRFFAKALQAPPPKPN